MGSSEFRFRRFTVSQNRAAMRVGTDGVLLGAWVCGNAPQRILDIGTGTGLLALMMAQRFTSAAVHAVEIEEGARLDALENFRRSPWSDRLHLVGEDLLDYVHTQPSGGYDLIVSNPPFFQGSLPSSDPAAMKARHQTDLSASQLLEAVSHLLADGGGFAVIYPFQGWAELELATKAQGLHPKRVCRVRTRPQKPWSRILVEGTRHASPTTWEEHVLMHDSSSAYSTEHRELTADFYLPK